MDPIECMEVILDKGGSWSRKTLVNSEPWPKNPASFFFLVSCVSSVQPKGLNPKLLRLISSLLVRITSTAARRHFDCLGIKMRLTTELDEVAVAGLDVICTRMTLDSVVNYSGWSSGSTGLVQGFPWALK